MVMVDLLELNGRDHADLAVEPAMMEPVDVLRDRDLEVVDAGLVPQEAGPVWPCTAHQNTSASAFS